MLWLLRWGPNLNLLIKRDNRGENTPCLQNNRPKLNAGLVWIYEAFVQLSSRREAGWSYQPIPFQSIIAWLDLYEVDDISIRQFFFKMIVMMDNAWLKYYAEKSAKPGSHPKRR